MFEIKKSLSFTSFIINFTGIALSFPVDINEFAICSFFENDKKLFE